MPPEKPLALVIATEDFNRLRSALFTEDAHENFAIALCGLSETEHERRLLLREMWPAPSSAYEKRLPYHLQIAPAFFNSVVDRCLATGLNPVIVHSHPDSESARYSPSDNFGEGRLLPVLADLLPGRQPASLLFTESDVAGRFFRRKMFVPLSRIDVRGVPTKSFGVTGSRHHKGKRFEGAFDRQIRAFGEEGQAQVESLKVGIVGLGGTGSIVAEQLVRAGISDLTLVDPDYLEPSNLSRVFGARWADASQRKSKADLVADHLRRIRESLTIHTIVDSVVRQPILLELRDRDLLFGCTDNHLSRSVLNRLAHQYITPLIDMGIRLDARRGDVTAAAGRVSVVGPGMTCLRCSGHIDSQRVRTESLSIDERDQLAIEGYIQGVADPVPAIISLNVTIAGLAVSAGLGLFVNLVGGPPPLGQIYDAKRGSVFVITPRHEPICDICSGSNGLKGLGDQQIVSAYE